MIKDITYIETQIKSEVKTEAPKPAEASSPKKAKVVVQQVQRETTSEEESKRANVANGQQPSQTPKEPNQSTANKFVLTPDYIQQSKSILHCKIKYVCDRNIN